MTRIHPAVRPTVLAACLAALIAPSAPAAPPPPLGTTLFAFPGATTNPATAASAGLVLADRWLGDDPAWNPSAAPGSMVRLSGLVLHVSRQDLRAGNRNYDETPAAFDGAGFAAGLPARGRFALSAYAFQPVLRRETSAFSRGTGAVDPMNPPGTIEAAGEARELRAGGALSVEVGPGRVGVGVEWTRRDDRYETIERSGSPTSGTTRLELAGDAVGFQLGGRLDLGDPGAGGVRLGAGVRRLPALAVDAPLTQDLLVGRSDSTWRAERGAGWEMGASARYAAGPAFRAIAALGGRTAQRWEGFDLAAGRAWEWKLAGEYHDARDPWTLRFGIGQEREDGVDEARADVLGLGFGWAFAWGTLDVGVAHRTLHRGAAPNSFEDRLVLTVGAPR